MINYRYRQREELKVIYISSHIKCNCRSRRMSWEDHMSTAFPEVRLKSFLEMRGADGGPWNTICALPAFWVGLLYDQTALDAAWAPMNF